MNKRSSVFCLVLALAIAGVTIQNVGAVEMQPDGTGPFHTYLTWQGDTSTTIIVNYQTWTDPGSSLIYYDTEPRYGEPELYGFAAVGTSHKIPGLEMYSDRTIHVVELTELVPGQTYYFVAGDPVTGFTEEKKFRTIPGDGDPIRFVSGGDLGNSYEAQTLLIHAAAEDPMFALIGGDIAYANGDLADFDKWDQWFSGWEDLMVTPDGHMIPMVLAIGNHEANGGSGWSESILERAPFYFGFFAQHGSGLSQERRAYFSHQFGPDMIIYILDTGHVTTYEEQTRWLAAEMAAHRTIEHQFAAYHVPMYPGHRDFDDESSSLVRANFLPLFDEFGLTAAFENHDHMFKRTKLLKNNHPDPDGTLYLGDGCFGVKPRSGDQAQRLEDPLNFPNELDELGLSESYLARWSSTRHFWIAEIPGYAHTSGTAIRFSAIDETGAVFDDVEIETGLWKSEDDTSVVDEGEPIVDTLDDEAALGEDEDGGNAIDETEPAVNTVDDDTTLGEDDGSVINESEPIVNTVDDDTILGEDDSSVIDESEPIVNTVEDDTTLGEDVDGNGAVNAVDVQFVIAALLGQDLGISCDSNADGRIDTVDLQNVINAALGL